MADSDAIASIEAPLTLPCGLTLPNRLVKCPMQETLAQPPFFDPPVDEFAHLYKKWSSARYGLIITGQVQIDIRFLSVAGDVVCHEHSLEGEHFAKWQRWAAIAKADGTPCIVQLAHPGRMSPIGAGQRPASMPPWCPSAVPVKLGGEGWLDRLVRSSILPDPKAMTLADIDELVAQFTHAARVAARAGFDGVQIHGAHGFLISQFLSSHTNRRDDAYGGDPARRLALLQRIVRTLRANHPRPFCLSVKLNSADYMAQGGLQQEEGLAQVAWLLDSGALDFIEISGGNAEQATSGLHNSFGARNADRAPPRASTRVREAFFTDFAEQVQALQARRATAGLPHVPIQLSGGYRSRVGMADGLDSGVTDLIGLGRAAVLEPELPARTLLNAAVPDERALGLAGFQVRGLWLADWFPVKLVGAGLGVQFFYHNMRRMGRGLNPVRNLSLPGMVLADAWETLRSGLATTLGRVVQGSRLYRPAEKID